jgi:hypothetical protein
MRLSTVSTLSLYEIVDALGMPWPIPWMACFFFSSLPFSISLFFKRKRRKKGDGTKTALWAKQGKPWAAGGKPWINTGKPWAACSQQSST